MSAMAAYFIENEIWATWAPCRGCRPLVPVGIDSLFLLHVLRHLVNKVSVFFRDLEQISAKS